MKVCFLALNAYSTLVGEAEDRVGGAEVQQKLLGEYLASRGHEVSFVTRDNGQEDGCLVNGCRVYKAFRYGAGIRFLRFLHPRLTGTWRALKRANADVYYQRCAGMETGLIALFCRLYGKRCVFASGSDSDFDPSSMIIPSRRDRWLYLYGLKRADLHVTQTVTQENALRQNFGINSVVVPNCWAEDCARRETDSGTDGYVLWVSTLRSWKRPGMFVDLAGEIPESRFMMIGGAAPTEEALYDHVRARAEQAGNIAFRGFVHFRDVGDFFDGAKMVVNTSEPKEGFPNAFLQAWCRNIPVVSTFDPGGVIAREGLGVVVDNVSDMVEAVRRIDTDKDAYKTLQRNIEGYFADNHDIRVLGPRYEKLFQDLVEGRP